MRRLRRLRGGNRKENALREPEKRQNHLTEDILTALASQDLSKADYPIYLDFTSKMYKLRTISGIASVNGPAVKELNLPDNKLRSFPQRDVGHLVNLKRLNLSGNRISQISLDWATLLQDLDLSKNRLTELPNLASNKALTRLDLTRNKISTGKVQQCFCSPQLRELRVDMNRLKWGVNNIQDDLIPAISLCKKLLRVSFRDNPFDSHVEHIVNHIAAALPKLEEYNYDVVTRKHRAKPLPELFTRDEDTEMATASTSQAKGFGASLNLKNVVKNSSPLGMEGDSGSAATRHGAVAERLVHGALLRSAITKVEEDAAMKAKGCLDLDIAEFTAGRNTDYTKRGSVKAFVSEVDRRFTLFLEKDSQERVLSNVTSTTVDSLVVALLKSHVAFPSQTVPKTITMMCLVQDNGLYSKAYSSVMNHLREDTFRGEECDICLSLGTQIVDIILEAKLEEFDKRYSKYLIITFAEVLAKSGRALYLTDSHPLWEGETKPHRRGIFPFESADVSTLVGNICNTTKEIYRVRQARVTESETFRALWSILAYLCADCAKLNRMDIPKVAPATDSTGALERSMSMKAALTTAVAVGKMFNQSVQKDISRVIAASRKVVGKHFAMPRIAAITLKKVDLTTGVKLFSDVWKVCSETVAYANSRKWFNEWRVLHGLLKRVFDGKLPDTIDNACLASIMTGLRRVMAIEPTVLPAIIFSDLPGVVGKKLKDKTIDKVLFRSLMKLAIRITNSCMKELSLRRDKDRLMPERPVEPKTGSFIDAKEELQYSQYVAEAELYFLANMKATPLREAINAITTELIGPKALMSQDLGGNSATSQLAHSEVAYESELKGPRGLKEASKSHCPLIQMVEGAWFFSPAEFVEVDYKDPIDSDIIRCMKMSIDLLISYSEFSSSVDEARAASSFLDMEDRDEIILNIFRCEYDDLRLAACQCLSFVPWAQIDSHEAVMLADFVSNLEDVVSGRTEELLVGIFRILMNLPSDSVAFTALFRERPAFVNDVINILIMNESRETMGDVVETRHRNALTAACIGFINHIWKLIEDAPASLAEIEMDKEGKALEADPFMPARAASEKVVPIASDVRIDSERDSSKPKCALDMMAGFIHGENAESALQIVLKSEAKREENWIEGIQKKRMMEDAKGIEVKLAAAASRIAATNFKASMLTKNLPVHTESTSVFPKANAASSPHVGAKGLEEEIFEIGSSSSDSPALPEGEGSGTSSSTDAQDEDPEKESGFNLNYDGSEEEAQLRKEEEAIETSLPGFAYFCAPSRVESSAIGRNPAVLVRILGQLPIESTVSVRVICQIANMLEGRSERNPHTDPSTSVWPVEVESEQLLDKMAQKDLRKLQEEFFESEGLMQVVTWLLRFAGVLDPAISIRYRADYLKDRVTKFAAKIRDEISSDEESDKHEDEDDTEVINFDNTMKNQNQDLAVDSLKILLNPKKIKVFQKEDGAFVFSDVADEEDPTSDSEGAQLGAKGSKTQVWKLQGDESEVWATANLAMEDKKESVTHYSKVDGVIGALRIIKVLSTSPYVSRLKRELFSDLKQAQIFCGLASVASILKFVRKQVGAKILDIMETVLELPAQSVVEEVKYLDCYGSAALFVQDVLKRCSAVVQTKGHLLATYQLLVARASSLLGVVIRQLAHIEFARIDDETNAEARLTNRACIRVLSNAIMPSPLIVSAVRLLSYLSTSYLASSSGKVTRKTTRASMTGMDGEDQGDDILLQTSEELTEMLAEYLRVNQYQRYDMLESFIRLDVTQNQGIPPAFLQHLLDRVEGRVYHQALGMYMLKNGMFPDGLERIAIYAQVEEQLVDASRVHRKVTIVITNAAWYLLHEPSGPKCVACPAHKFCPTGPVLKRRISFGAIRALIEGYCGQRLYVTYVAGGQLFGKRDKVKKHIFMCREFLVAKNLMKAFMSLVPEGQIVPAREQTTRTAVKMITDEEVVLYTGLSKINKRGREQDRHLALTATHLYNFDENAKEWAEGHPMHMLKLRTKHSLLDVDTVETSDSQQTEPRLTITFTNKHFYNLRFGCWRTLELWRLKVSAMAKECKRERSRKEEADRAKVSAKQKSTAKNK